MNKSDQTIDLQIVSDMQSGDRKAFARLYDRHATWLMAVACRILQNRADAEDLLHDVFIEVWNKAGSYNPERGSVRSWLAIRARSRALDRLRTLTKNRGKQTNEPENEIENHPINIESSIGPELGIDHQKARRAIDGLSTKHRTVIQLSYFHGLTFQEIADRCEIPLGTVKSRMASALVSLRQQIDPRRPVPHAFR